MQHDRRALEASICRDSLAEFFKCAWPIVESVKLEENWHLDAICDHIQALLENRVPSNKLIVNVPPRCGKTSVALMAALPWMWTKNPKWRSIFASGNEQVLDLTTAQSHKLIESEWYQKTFKPKWRFDRKRDGKQLYANTEGGSRRSVTTGARITGEGADALFVDDPIDAQYANSEAHREASKHWFDQAFSTRLNHPGRGTICVIMQRLHDQDLSGHLLSTGLYELLKISQEFEPKRNLTTCIGFTDPRTVEGQLMFPERFPESWLKVQRIQLGSRGYAGQHQQNPTPLEGGIIKRKWLKYYGFNPLEALAKFEQIIQSWDLTFKETSDSDFVVGQVWGRIGGDFYLLDQVRDRMDFPATIAAIRAFVAKWPRAYLKLVEDKANGPAVIATLKHEIHGLVAYEPIGSKDARAHSAAPTFEAGNVYIPEPSSPWLSKPWVNDYVEELVAFSGEGSTVHDDQIDATTAAIHRLRQFPTGLMDYYREAAEAAAPQKEGQHANQ